MDIVVICGSEGTDLYFILTTDYTEFSEYRLSITFQIVGTNYSQQNYGLV